MSQEADSQIPFTYPIELPSDDNDFMSLLTWGRFEPATKRLKALNLTTNPLRYIVHATDSDAFVTPTSKNKIYKHLKEQKRRSTLLIIMKNVATLSLNTYKLIQLNIIQLIRKYCFLNRLIH